MPRFRAEAPWAWRLLSRLLRELPAGRRTETPGRAPTVADAAGESPLVLVLADPEAYLLREPAARLIEALATRPDLELVLPVTNEPGCEAARAAPPFAYPTPTLLREACEAIAASAGPLVPVAAPASPVYAVRRAALERLAPAMPLAAVPSEAGLRAAVDPGAYLHRYGAMDASPREDLASRVPIGARAVLDVGCSRGATAAALRARGVEFIAGIEPDAEDAAEAERVYDRVIRGRLEDPSDALVRVRPWLSPAGVVVASVPNLGHWAIVDDLLRGRFDYVPYSILSGTHVRFFTRATLRDLFEASGYRVRSIDTVVLPDSPGGAGRRDRLAAFPGASADLDAAEFLAVAQAER